MQYNQLSKIDDYGTQFFDFLFVVIIFTSYNQYVFKFSTPDLFFIDTIFFSNYCWIYFSSSYIFTISDSSTTIPALHPKIQKKKKRSKGKLKRK